MHKGMSAAVVTETCLVSSNVCSQWPDAWNYFSLKKYLSYLFNNAEQAEILARCPVSAVTGPQAVVIQILQR